MNRNSRRRGILDKTLMAFKKFYPRDYSSAEDRRRLYATQFPVVEVDTSCYAMPSPQNSALWVERTPPDFTFNIKEVRLFMGHQTAPSVLPKVAEALGPIEKKDVYYKGHASRVA